MEHPIPYGWGICCRVISAAKVQILFEIKVFCPKIVADERDESAEIGAS